MQKQAFDLVLAIYRITNLFPEGEVLIKQIRKTANQVLREAILGRVKEITKQIEVLLGYIDIAQNQRWVKDINFVILKKEYQELLNNVNKSKKKVKRIKKVNPPERINNPRPCKTSRLMSPLSLWAGVILWGMGRFPVCYLRVPV